MHAHVDFSPLDRFTPELYMYKCRIADLARRSEIMYVRLPAYMAADIRTYVLHLDKINQAAFLPACYTLEC